MVLQFEMLVIFVSLLIAQPVSCLVNNGFFSTDQKANCSKNIAGSYCYDGPKFDVYGQYKSCSVPGTIAFTFDDSPDETGTKIILDIAKKYNMKVTFFVIGDKLTMQYRPLLQQMIDDGHQIASHTYSHVNFLTKTVQKQEDEIIKFERALTALRLDGPLANNNIPSFLKFPHGAASIQTMELATKLGYTVIHWSFLNGDSENTYRVSENDILNIHYEHMGGQTGNGVTSAVSILVTQHDKVPATYKSFEAVAKYYNETFGSRGIRFTTVADCLGNRVSAYRVNPRYINDPQCKFGIRSKDTCCPVTCGRCGGKDCNILPGGDKECCSLSIRLANFTCDNTMAPCVITSSSLPMYAIQHVYVYYIISTLLLIALMV